MSEMLKIENIRKVFNPGTINEKVALDGVDLTLEEGEFVTVIGGTVQEIDNTECRSRVYGR